MRALLLSMRCARGEFKRLGSELAEVVELEGQVTLIRRGCYSTDYSASRYRMKSLASAHKML
jgi:hypothetical protein